MSSNCSFSWKPFPFWLTTNTVKHYMLTTSSTILDISPSKAYGFVKRPFLPQSPSVMQQIWTVWRRPMIDMPSLKPCWAKCTSKEQLLALPGTFTHTHTPPLNTPSPLFHTTVILHCQQVTPHKQGQPVQRRIYVTM